MKSQLHKLKRKFQVRDPVSTIASEGPDTSHAVDYPVVGVGSAGCVRAARLAEAGHRVRSIEVASCCCAPARGWRWVAEAGVTTFLHAGRCRMGEEDGSRRAAGLILGEPTV